MSYAQKNYNEIQGINGKYRINQIGCFLTSFCNLLTEEFGRPVDPLTLNRIFRDRGIYIDVDDGVKDDLGYQSVTAYDGTVVVAQTSTKGMPTGSNCIVKLKAGNRFGTHFCKVHHIEGNTVYITDSYDGKVKKSTAYGVIMSWASYRDIKPQPVTPITPAPPVQSTNVVVVQKGDGISHVAKNAGYSDWQSQDRWSYIARLNGHNSWQSLHGGLKVGQQIIVRPAEIPKPPVEAPPIPQPQPVDNWQATYTQSSGYFRLTDNVDIVDLEGKLPAVKATSGQGFRRAGTVVKDGVKYARTEKSATTNIWYAVPVDKLVASADPKQVAKLDIVPKQPEIEDDLDKIFNDISLSEEFKEFKDNLNTKKRVIKTVASTESLITNFANSLKFWKGIK